MTRSGNSERRTNVVSLDEVRNERERVVAEYLGEQPMDSRSVLPGLDFSDDIPSDIKDRLLNNLLAMSNCTVIQDTIENQVGVSAVPDSGLTIPSEIEFENRAAARIIKTAYTIRTNPGWNKPDDGSTFGENQGAPVIPLFRNNS